MPNDVKKDKVDRDTDVRTPYEAPKVLATYGKEELEEAIQPSGGGGCGCGCGS